MTASCDPKAMAKTLRADLARRDINLSHSDCLELVAHQLGYTDWNTAAAARDVAEPLLQLPENWFVAGSAPHDYQVGIDPKKPDHPATIYSKRDGRQVNGFATLMQNFDAAAYHGKRIRLVGEMSCADLDGLATIWMRVDGVEKGGIRFDNMLTRQEEGPLRGNMGWTRREIVLDVPIEAEKIAFGFMLEGMGQCWCRAFRVEIVGSSVPVTSATHGPLAVPTNLDFAPKPKSA